MSSLGKGLSAASLGAILQSRGYRIKLRKLDPYLNIDPGTMNPNQHGEVYVTNDGAETDLDLGHYERFTGVPASKNDNITAGRVYQNVITNERKGKYLGKTVQVIPHVTDEIKQSIFYNLKNVDFLILEVGGTVGDIESLPFLEAIRQLRNQLSQQQTVYIHVTLVPYLSAADEQKTKPTQHSVKELREIGIQPDILICRCEKKISLEDKKKIALFCNINEKNIIQAVDLKSIYALPVFLHSEKLDERVLEILKIIKKSKLPNLEKWKRIIHQQKVLAKEVSIGIIGKYVKLKDAYKSLIEAIYHSGLKNNTKVIIEWIDSENKKGLNKKLSKLNGILVPGGFGNRGVEGKIEAIKFARVNKTPYLGICFGMQLAVIEIAKNLLNIEKASSSEFKKKNSENIIGLLTEWKKGSLDVKRDTNSDLGGTMRLGAYKCILEKNSLINSIYKKNQIYERHRHRYEMNIKYEKMFKKVGMHISGKSPDKKLPEVVELESHPWFIGVQFHPELMSSPLKSHPLFNSYIAACVNNKKEKNAK